MNIKKSLIVLLSVFIIGNVSAQATLGKLPSITGGVGVLIFNGNIGQGTDLSSYSKIRIGYNLGIEQRFGKVFGVALNGLYGKLAESERSKTSNLNFESVIYQGDLSLTIRTDRLFPNASLTPFIAAGIGYLAFNPMGDMKDKNGNKYYGFLPMISI